MDACDPLRIVSGAQFTGTCDVTELMVELVQYFVIIHMISVFVVCRGVAFRAAHRTVYGDGRNYDGSCTVRTRPVTNPYP
jgi:hypothetical protein